MATYADENPLIDADRRTLDDHVRQMADEAAHTVSIWNSNKRGTGARRIFAVGYSGAQGIAVSQAPHPAFPEVRGYDYYPTER